MLTKRLAACAAQVTPAGVVCDVGTDHAYLPAELLQSKTRTVFGLSVPCDSPAGGRSECFVFRVAHRLAPLVRGAFAGYFHCQMREPAIGCSTVPVLDLRGNVHHIARM